MLCHYKLSTQHEQFKAGIAPVYMQYIRHGRNMCHISWPQITRTGLRLSSAISR